jgi:3-deoxy-manno-octulosonate cytidylyltransferase (CMP-KDO synthetase)
MKTVALIPARYDATRFAGKLMADLKGKPVIRHTYDATVATGLFDEVLVVTDSEQIFDEILTHGGRAMMSKKKHESGTDRIAEAAESLPFDLIVNVQGDTPFIKKQPLQTLLEQFREPAVEVGSLMQVLNDPALVADPNYVKVCVDKKMNALFFSRSVIPFPRNKELAITYFEHIGVYAFRKEALIRFTTWPVSGLEDAEKIECLRFLENGVNIRMVLTDYLGVEIDTPEDLEKAARLFK